MNIITKISHEGASTTIISEREYKYSREDIEDILSCAFEGGINYWAGLDNSTSSWESVRKMLANKNDELPTLEEIAAELLLTGFRVTLYDIEDYDEWELTGEKLIEGICVAIENNDWDGDMDTVDGCAGDCIIQYALFGEIVYG